MIDKIKAELVICGTDTCIYSRKVQRSQNRFQRYDRSQGPFFGQCCQEVQFGAVIMVITSLRTTGRRSQNFRNILLRLISKLADRLYMCSIKTRASQKSTACCVQHKRKNVINSLAFSSFSFSDQSRPCVDFHDGRRLV